MLDMEAVEQGDYLSRLDEASQKKELREIYESEYNSISDEDAFSLVASDFRSNKAPKHRVFTAVKNAFHPDNDDGFRTEYEVSHTNPLYERRENPADLLLTETNRRSMNLCFVICEPNGDTSDRWSAHINEIHDLVVGHKDYLLNQIGHSDKKIDHIQYATATLKKELRDVEFRYIYQASPDNYSLWAVDEDYEPDSDEVSPPLVQLQSEGGQIEHNKLNGPLSDGVDYLDSKNTEICLALTTPPVISLRETLMTLLTKQHSSVTEPREFDHGDFVSVFKDLCEVSPSGDEKDDLLEEEADNLIELAKEADVIFYGNSDSIHENRDYRARYSQGKSTEGLKKSIRKKVFQSRVPEKKSEVAYSRAKEKFDPDHIGTKYYEF